MKFPHTCFVAGLVFLGACGSDVVPPSGSPTTITSTPTTRSLVPPPTTTGAPTTTAAPDRAPIRFPTGIVPTRIEIPALGVDAPVIDLNLSGSQPEVPTAFGDAGWYEQTRLPGEIGPAVIAGHIDSRTGPAVFYKLDQLVAGDRVVVHDGLGGSRIFEVLNAAQYPKDALPPEVFGFGEPVPELRLITCGGMFDTSSGHYEDNIVVYTRLVTEAD